MIFPVNAVPGDKIAIIAPATTIKPEYIDGAVARLSALGFNPVVMPHAKGPASGSYASSIADRLADFNDAYTDSDVKAILCARGGYGVVHLLDKIDREMLRRTPKWVIGYSDISAFHALMYNVGIASLHAPMAKHLSIEPESDFAVAELLEIIAGKPTTEYRLPAHPLNRPGSACGRLKGGNLAVLAGLIATPFDLLSADSDEDVILFIEDIAEAIYSTERMLWHLKHTDTLHRIKGLIVGQFTEYRPDLNWQTTEEMISARLSEFGITDIPVVFDFPVGHVSRNYPMIEGVTATLEVTPTGTTFRMEKR